MPRRRDSNSSVGSVGKHMALLRHCMCMKLSYSSRTLATSQYLVDHRPMQRPDAPQESSPVPATACSHYFIDALSWMRSTLEQGKLEGRLECPKCKTNVGKYAWQGMQCSCGDWVVPGISLAKGRIDEAKTRAAAEGSVPAEVSAIRLPPGPMKRPGNL